MCVTIGTYDLTRGAGPPSPSTLQPPPEPGVGGVCRDCLPAEIEETIVEEHPDLERGD